MAGPLVGRDFAAKLEAQGLLPPETVRMVIDIKHDDVVRVYVERFGEEGWLDENLLAQLASGAEVVPRCKVCHG
jgi:hypothetical protein